MHFFGQERHDVILNDLVDELNELVHGNDLIVVDVELEEVRVEVFLGRLNPLQLEVALDQCLKLCTVNLAIVLAVRALENLLQLIYIALTQLMRVMFANCV